MKVTKFFLGLSIVCLLGVSQLNGQTDWVSWSSIRLKTSLPSGIEMAARPIMRHNQNLSNYANTSLDLSIAKKFKSNFSGSILYRYWWVDEGPNRIFWWFNIAHKEKLSEKLSLNNRLRYHLALDYKSYDPNFIRYLPMFNYKVNDRWTLLLGSEIWFQVDQDSDLRRFRNQAGFLLGIRENITLNFQYWLEDSIGLDPGFIFHTLVATFTVEI